MDNTFQSFMPKAPVQTATFSTPKMGVLSKLMMMLFILAFLFTVAMFGYLWLVTGQVRSLQGELASAEANIDKKSITDMDTFSRKLEAVKGIINRHLASSRFASVLASSTVSNVYFTEYSYSHDVAKGLTAKLSGISVDYPSLALQEKILNENPSVKNTVFSNIKLTDKGFVGFDVNVTLDPSLANYVPDTTIVPIQVSVQSTTPDENIDTSSLDNIDDI